MKEYFAEQKKKEKKRWFSSLAFWRKDQNYDASADGYLNDHSRAIYLMAPDNKFLAFYPLDLSEHELATQLIEDMSYDIGVSHIGTKNTPLHDRTNTKMPSFD